MLLEIARRLPAKILLRLLRSHRVSLVMSAFSRIWNLLNKRFISTKFVEQDAHDFTILFLVAFIADVIDLAGLSLMKRRIDPFAMIEHMDPFPHLRAFAIKRNLLTIQQPHDEEGNELFGILPRTVV